ncbi:hypothetical protein H0H92_015194, partial [Tricholoma furcatifolium]
ENESRDNDFVRIPVEHETNDPVVTEQPNPQIKDPVVETNLKDLQAQAIAAIAEASEILAKMEVGECVVIGELALSLLGAKTTLDLSKIEALVFLDMSVEEFWEEFEETAGPLYVDQPTGVGKRLQVELSESRVVIDLIPIFQQQEDEKFIWDDLDTKNGVKILSPGALLLTTVLRWILAYDIVLVGRPSSVLWNRYAEETQNVLLLLKYLATAQANGTEIDTSMLRNYPAELMTSFFDDIYQYALSESTITRFGLEDFTRMDSRTVITKGIVGSIESKHMLEGPGKEIEDFIKLLITADLAIKRDLVQLQPPLTLLSRGLD